MKVKDIVEILDCEVLSGENKLEQEVKSVGAGDMMSDILALATPGMMLLTAHTSPQSVRTGMVTEIMGIVVIQNKNIPQQTIDLAKKNNFLLMRTNHFMFVSCGKLYESGFKGLNEQ